MFGGFSLGRVSTLKYLLCFLLCCALLNGVSNSSCDVVLTCVFYLMIILLNDLKIKTSKLKWNTSSPPSQDFQHSLTLNPTLICFPYWKCLHMVLVGLDIFVISLTIKFKLIFSRLSKCKWPTPLCPSQLSSSFSKKQISSTIYMLFGSLYVVTTNIPYFFFLVSHFFESNKVCFLGHTFDSHLVGYGSSFQ